MALTMTQFRRSLADQIDHVRSGGGAVLIYRFGKPAAALVSIEQLEMIHVAEDEMRNGPMDRSGTRLGLRAWRAVREKLGLAPPGFDRQQDVLGKTPTTGPSWTHHRMRDECRPGDWDKDGELKDVE